MKSEVLARSRELGIWKGDSHVRYVKATALATFSVCNANVNNQQHQQRAPGGPRAAGICDTGGRRSVVSPPSLSH